MEKDETDAVQCNFNGRNVIYPANITAAKQAERGAEGSYTRNIMLTR